MHSVFPTRKRARGLELGQNLESEYPPVALLTDEPPISSLELIPKKQENKPLSGQQMAWYMLISAFSHYVPIN